LETGKARMRIRKFLSRFKPLQHWAVRIFGMRLTDAVSGQDLGKYLVLPWRGKVYFIGQDQAHEKAFVPVFLPQARVTYWKQTLGFQQHTPPDFPNERHRNNPAEPPTA
jgi:hypothetical protein